MRTAATVTTIALAAMGLAGLAQAQQRLPRECRQEVRQLCGTDRSKMRACLREKASELSDNCRSELRERAQQRRGNGQRQQVRAASPDSVIAFGAHSRQQVDFYSPKSDEDAAPTPVILFVHGGAWTMGNRAQAVHAKPAHFTANGIAFASTGYRLVPEVSVEDQARDVAAAIAALRGQAEVLNIDPNRIVLMGHSAGAHLAALVATDPQYAGADPSAVQGVVLLDGAGYDVERNMSEARIFGRRLYTKAFGDDPQRQAALSPITYVGAPDAPNWMILFVEGRESSQTQSEALTLALREAGAMAEALPIADTDHSRLNRELGRPGDPATVLVDEFLAQLLAD